MIVRIPTRTAVKREKETDFILIGENQLTTDFSCEDAAKALAYIIGQYVCIGIQQELLKILQQLFSSEEDDNYEEILDKLKVYAEKFEVK